MSEQGYALCPLRIAVADHIGGGTPSRQVPSYWKGSIPWASVKDFPEHSGIITDTEEHISPAGLISSASNLIPAGTPLVCTRMAVGRAAMPTVYVAINQDVKALFPVKSMPGTYLLKLLQFIQPKAEAQAVGSTVKGIRIQDYLGIEVPLADADVQPIIVEILDTLDSAIHETEAIIAKLRAVKQGLLHDLLTRGIDANGELRPPQAEAPHLYKESPLGWIPKDWEVRRGQEVCTEIVVGIVIRPTQHYCDEGIPVLRSANVRENKMSLENLVFMSHKDHRAMKKSSVRPGDVLTVRTGYPGTSCVVDDVLDEANCVDIIISRPASNILASFWAKWVNSDYGKRQVLAAQGGLAQQHFNVGDLQNLIVSLPPMTDQRAISGQLQAFDDRLIHEEETAKSLYAVKAGLMDDLLTGRVRVTPLLGQPDKDAPDGSI